MFEEALFHLLNKLHKKHSIDSICIAGGCGMNSVANGKIRRNTSFKNVYIQAAAGDAGGAIGAAYSSHFKQNPYNKISYVMKDAYLVQNMMIVTSKIINEQKRKYCQMDVL